MTINIKGANSVHHTHKLTDNLQHNTEHSNLLNAKSQMRFNNLKSSNNSLTQNISAKINNYNLPISQCVTNLNLTKVHIDKLYSENIKKAYNRNVKKYDSCIPRITSRHKDKRRGESYQDDFIEPLLSKNDIYHINLLKELYLNIKINDTENNDYIVLVIYQTITNTDLINKQLITAIPINNGKATRSISEITIVEQTGKLKKHNKTVCLHTGGIIYTKDWLKIEEVKKLNLDNPVYKFTINYDDTSLNGIYINSLNDAQDNLSILKNSTLHIADFSKIWIP